MRTVLMAVRTLSGESEAEPVEVSTDTFGETTLTLDDGTELVFDAGELQSSIAVPRTALERKAA